VNAELKGEAGNCGWLPAVVAVCFEPVESLLLSAHDSKDCILLLVLLVLLLEAPVCSATGW
jgi:hypothetical protein